MGKTITLSDIKIHSWEVDVVRKSVTASYSVLDDETNEYGDGYAIFWVTIPDPGHLPGTSDPSPLPDIWYQLPLAYEQILTDLTQDLRQALLHLLD